MTPAQQGRQKAKFWVSKHQTKAEPSSLILLLARADLVYVVFLLHGDQARQRPTDSTRPNTLLSTLKEKKTGAYGAWFLGCHNAIERGHS